MGKVRIVSAVMFFFFFFNETKAQYTDTFSRHGFESFQEAADSLFARFVAKKMQKVQVFTIDYAAFIEQTRLTDTVIPEQMIRGQYVAYWSKVERSYKKVWKKLKKRGISAKRAIKDTVLVYKNSGSGVSKAELYIVQRKYKAYVKFQLWEVNGLWFFSGKMDLVEESVPKKR